MTKNNTATLKIICNEGLRPVCDILYKSGIHYSRLDSRYNDSYCIESYLTEVKKSDIIALTWLIKGIALTLQIRVQLVLMNSNIEVQYLLD
jgi:hypothetical protein